MTPLKPSEKRMLIAISIAAFALLNLLGWNFWSRSMTRVNRRAVTLESRKKQLLAWKEAAPEANAKLAWINRNLTAYRDEAQREIYLDAVVRTRAEANGLEIRKNVPLEARFDEHFIRSAYAAEVTGPWEAVTRFLWELEDPPELRRIRRATFTFRKRDGSDADRPDIICEFEIEKFWAKESGTLDLAGPDEVSSQADSGNGLAVAGGSAAQ